MKATYFNSQPNLGFPSLFSASQNFHGGGPVIGILSNWIIGKYFGFLAKLSTSMLYGKVSVKQNLEEVVNMNFNTTSRVLTYSETNQELLPNFQMQLGASCGACFCKTMFLEFTVSWEANYWFNQYLLSFIQPSSGIFDDIFNKPVTQQGITAQIRLDF